MLDDCEVINVVASEDTVEKDVVNNDVGDESKENEDVNSVVKEDCVADN